MFVGYLVMDFLEKEGTPDDVRRQIYRYYGTFTYTILTMFEVIFANWPIPCRLLVDYVDEWFSLYFIIYRCVVGVLSAIRESPVAMFKQAQLDFPPSIGL
ncbi:unnamed protein product [Durusdinium trenchii]|uniref:Uncharacterized protein n=1 Tax=Durusdinium trenchii TaxID=1381693 RepID=A0ABP0P2U1_9DINO